MFRAFLFFVSLTSVAQAKVPQEALDLLNSLPGKKITLDLVLKQAMKESDSFRQVLATKALADLAYHGARAKLDYQLTGSYGRLTDKTEPVSSFSPTSVSATSYSLGVATAFTSGTGVSVDYSHGPNNIEIPSVGLNSDYYDTKTTFGLSQNLLKNTFGYSSRREKAAGDLLKDSGELSFKENVGEWGVGLSNLFYRAWLAQEQAKTALENVKRRRRLVHAVTVKTRRGTSEQPDLLQAKSALLGAEAQELQAHQTLMEAWRTLIITLKFPESWIAIDPILVPIGLDSPYEAASKICVAKKFEVTRGVKAAQLKAKAYEMKLEAAQNNAWPDLNLKGTYSSNGVNSVASESISESTSFKHPKWYVGVEFSMALEGHGNKAALKSAFVEAEQAAAQANDQMASNRINWLNACANLQRSLEAHQKMSEVLKFQTSRAHLEEKRFSIGRVSVFNVVQAGDDAAMSESNLNGAEVDRRMAAWKVLRLSGGVVDYLRNLGAKNL